MLVARPAAKPSAFENLALAKYRSVVLARTLEDVAQRMPSRDDILTLHQRAAVSPGDTSAYHLTQTAFGSYLGSLSGSAAARIIALGITVPMGRAEGFVAPTRNTAPSALPWIEEGEPIPVRAFDFNSLMLAPKKLAAISVVSRELAKRAGGEAAVRQLLREDAELSLDPAYFSTTAASDAAHAGCSMDSRPLLDMPAVTRAHSRPMSRRSSP